MKKKGRVEARAVLYYKENEMSNGKKGMSNGKKGMSITELIEVAKKIVVTDADIIAMNKRMCEAEARFEAEARARAVDEKWLNLQYTI